MADECEVCRHRIWYEPEKHRQAHDQASLDLYKQRQASTVVEDPKQVTLFAPSSGPVGLVNVTVRRRGDVLTHAYRAGYGDEPESLPADWFQEGDRVEAERLN